jgi:hypothetical protein
MMSRLVRVSAFKLNAYTTEIQLQFNNSGYHPLMDDTQLLTCCPAVYANRVLHFHGDRANVPRMVWSSPFAARLRLDRIQLISFHAQSSASTLTFQQTAQYEAADNQGDFRLLTALRQLCLLGRLFNTESKRGLIHIRIMSKTSVVQIDESRSTWFYPDVSWTSFQCCWLICWQVETTSSCDLNAELAISGSNCIHLHILFTVAMLHVYLFQTIPTTRTRPYGK